MYYNTALNLVHKGVHAGFQPHSASNPTAVGLKPARGHYLLGLAQDGRPISSIVDGGQPTIPLTVYFVTTTMVPSHDLISPLLSGSHLG